MAQANLTTYIKQIEAKYITAREDYEKKTAELDKLTKDYKDLDRSLYSSQGLTVMDEKYYIARRTKERELNEIGENFTKDAEQIQANADKIFNKVYGFTPELVDNRGLAILESANMTDKEIIKLAEYYKENFNNTMFFICIDKLKDKNNPDNIKIMGEAQRLRDSRPDHDIIAGFVHCCNSALRPEKFLSDGVAKHHEEFLQSHIAAAENITANVPDIWSD